MTDTIPAPPRSAAPAATELLPDPPLHKTKSWQHQIRAYHHAMKHRGAMLPLKMGCVSCDTEFLSPDGWKRIDEWDGERVAQYDPENENAKFVKPLRFIKEPCKTLIHFKHTRGLDQMLSDEHRVLWFDYWNYTRPRVNTAAEIFAGARGTAMARYMTAFTLDGPGLSLTEEQLRLQIAAMADGSFPPRADDGSTTVLVRLQKTRKIRRLRVLLKDAGVSFTDRPCSPKGYRMFRFQAPLKTKEFPKEFWKQTSLADRQVICDECYRWDGSAAKSGAVEYYSTIKENAEFIQFCFASTGRRASIRSLDRRGQKRGKYTRKSIEYSVHAVGTGRSGNFCNYVAKRNAKRVRSPDGFKYCFEVPSGFLVLRRNGAIFCTGNSGKSLVAINVAANMPAKKTLIIGPARALGVWPREFELHAPIPFKLAVLNKGSTKDKIAVATQAMAMANARSEPIVVVANYESAIRPEFQQFALSKLWDLIIADEAHRCKDATGATGKFMGKLGFVGKKKIALTGTPLPHDKLDAFSQYRFLDCNVFGMSYVSFRQRYAKMHEVFSGKVTQWLNDEEFNEKFWSIAYYDDGSSAPDLPEYTDQIIPVEMSKRGQAIYDEMEEQLIVEVEQGIVTAANALVRLLRLQQILSGFVTTEDGKLEEVDDSKERALVGLMEDMAPDDPIVVFTWFKHDLIVIKRIAEQFGRRYGEVSGDRSDLTSHAKMPDDIDLMGVQIQSGGTGVDLTRARYGVYYSASFNNGLMEQSFYRLYRPGQQRTCHFLRLVAEGTVDRAIYGTLAKRQDLVAGVMDYLKMRGSAQPS